MRRRLVAKDRSIPLSGLAVRKPTGEEKQASAAMASAGTGSVALRLPSANQASVAVSDRVAVISNLTFGMSVVTIPCAGAAPVIHEKVRGRLVIRGKMHEALILPFYLRAGGVLPELAEH